MKRLIGLAAASAALYALLLQVPHWGRDFPAYAALHGALLLPWMGAFLVVRRVALAGTRVRLAVILAGAVLFRGLLVLAEPTLSDDLYRYLWDGRVLLEGINPYRFAPPAPELSALRDANWALINNPDLPTIYPPLLMVVFAAVAAISPTVTAMKAAMALCDLGAGILLAIALRASGRRPELSVLYLWHPLVVVEFAGQGHADAVGLLLVSAALAAWFARRNLVTGILLAAAGLVKFLPWSVLPLFLRRLGWRWLALPLLVGAFYAPFALGGVNPLGSLTVYAEKWRSNDYLFGVLLAAVEPTVPDAPVVDEAGVTRMPEDVALRRARLAGAALVAAVWLLLLVRRRPWPEVYSWTLGTLFLVSPVVHPWYLTWLLPVALFVRHPGWWLWAALAVLAYAPLPRYLAGGPWSESTVIKSVEYLPVLALVAVQAGLEIRGRAASGSSPPSRPDTVATPAGPPA